MGPSATDGEDLQQTAVDRKRILGEIELPEAFQAKRVSRKQIQAIEESHSSSDQALESDEDEGEQESGEDSYGDESGEAEEFSYDSDLEEEQEVVKPKSAGKDKVKQARKELLGDSSEDDD